MSVETHVVDSNTDISHYIIYYFVDTADRLYTPHLFKWTEVGRTHKYLDVAASCTITCIYLYVTGGAASHWLILAVRQAEFNVLGCFRYYELTDVEVKENQKRRKGHKL